MWSWLASSGLLLEEAHTEETADIKHVPGAENVVADAWSRPPAVAAVVLPASTGLHNWAQLATVQTTCEDLAALRAKRQGV